MSRAEFVDELYYALDGFDAHSIPGHDIAEKRILAAHDAAVAEAVGEAIVPLGEWLEPCVYCSGQRTSGSCRCEPCRGTGWRVRPSVFDALAAERDKLQAFVDSVARRLAVYADAPNSYLRVAEARGDFRKLAEDARNALAEDK